MIDKEKIAHAALHLFAEKGIDTTTFEEVARDTGYYVDDIHLAYSDFYQLAQELLDKHFKEIINNLMQLLTVSDSLDHFIQNLVQVIAIDFEQRTEVYKFLLISAHHPTHIMPEVTLIDFGRHALGIYGFDERQAAFLSNCIMGIIVELIRSILNGHLQGKFSDYTEEATDACLALIHHFSSLKKGV